MNEESSDNLDFLKSLPRLEREDTFSFSCSPGVSCFNECCADLNLSLSPYDVIRLRHALNASSKEFFDDYTEVGMMPGNGFPVVMLKMRDDVRKSCPFVREEGCSVYENRPGACRVYPLGRGASVGENGEIVEQYILVHEAHCLGFQENREWKVAEFLDNQGMAPYVENDDKYMALVNRCNQAGRALSKEMFGNAFVSMYRPDVLARFSGQENLMNEVVPKRDDMLSYETDVYRFGLEWLSKLFFDSARK